MGKTLTFQVINNRLMFRCPACGVRRNMALPPNLRQKNIKCHKCSEITKCRLNRRTKPRELQCGKVVLITSDSRETEVNLHDISHDGAGFDLPPGTSRARKLSIGSKVRFKCGWRPSLFGSCYYEVKSIVGQRVGVRRV